MLAWLMNDQPLAPINGAPLRLVIPFRYGARSVKAVSEITFGSPSLPNRAPPTKGLSRHTCIVRRNSSLFSQRVLFMLRSAGCVRPSYGCTPSGKMTMRISAIVLLAGAALAQALPAQQQPVSDSAGGPQPVGTMSELMVHLIYPTSDAIFYILTRTPTSTAEWGVLEGQALMLAE